MTQFRFKGFTANGRLTHGEFEASSSKEANEKIKKLSRLKSISIQKLEKKEVYVYKVQKPGKPVITGEQEAYSKEEVEKALLKLGYTIIRVEKRLINFKGRVPTTEVVTFMRLSADLLRQNLSYDEILNLLYEDTGNKRMKETIRQIQKDLKDGKEGMEVYGKHEDVFGKFAAYMLSVASTSGNMALVFESTAKFLERDATFKKNMRRTLLMPSINVLAVIGVVLFYVGYIFPTMAKMFLKMKIKLPPMTAATLSFSNVLQSNWVAIAMSFVIPIGLFAFYIRTPAGRLWFDKVLIKIPVIGDLMHKTSIEIFSRVFYTLYSGSGQNIEVIRTAAEACRNSFMEKQIKAIAIKNMLKGGTGLVEALESTGVFTRTALSRFRLGAESGAIRDNTKQLADYYEVQTGYKMDSTVDMINLLVNLFILVVLMAITIISSETAIVQPHFKGM
ncbi:MAG TPA: type II secretion system F family protein [Balneolales bacterium]|nr:type II secretion system F family protein [Balneolales bacterium]